MDDLLPFYERELTFLRRHAREFAERYPKIAGRLAMAGETVEDPHVERLMEAFALLTARVHKKLDDDYPQFTEALLQVLYPHYLRPFPSCSIARFDAGGALAQLTEPLRIERETLLNTRPIQGVTCRFRTAYAVDLAPIGVSHAGYETILTPPAGTPLPANASAAISIRLSALSDSATLDSLRDFKLRFFIDGESSLVTHVREALFTRTLAIAVDGGRGAWQLLPADALRPVGFADDEALIDYDARSHVAYRLLTEYFAYPEKFNFFELDFERIRACLPTSAREFTLRILMTGLRDNVREAKLLEQIDPNTFVLGCTPVVNLFTQRAEPIRVTHAKTNYSVVADHRRAHAYEVYAIVSVKDVRQTPQGEAVLEYRPFYALRHGESLDAVGRFWHMTRDEQLAARSPGFEYEISIVDLDFNPTQPQADTLSIDLVCTNRDLPAQMPYGEPGGDLFFEGGGPIKSVSLMRRPSLSTRFSRGHGAHWRLISHLSLNHLSLADRGIDALREQLMLYDLPRSAQNQRIIGGLESIGHRVTTARIEGEPFPSFVRGSEIRLTLNEDHFVGSGVHLFAEIMDRFFGMYVQANSFTQLIVLSARNQRELIRCKPRNGDSILV